MPDEPHSKIDELLKTYAEKRREEAGAPLEMHPATRKLLHDEVARLQPKPASQSDSWVSAWLLFWPRLVWGVAILLVVAGAAWMLMPSLMYSPDSSASKTRPSLSSDNEAQMALAKGGSARDEELPGPSVRLEDRSKADESSPNTVRLQLEPPNLPANIRTRALAEKNEIPPASPAPIDALKSPARPTPSLAADGQKENAVREAGTLIDRGVGILSAGALAESPAPTLNGQRQLFDSQPGALAGEGKYSVELAPPVSDFAQTNGAFLGTLSPQRFGPVPASPALVQNRPEETRFYFRDEAAAKKDELTLSPKQKVVSGQKTPSVTRELASDTRADKSDPARLRFNQVMVGTDRARQTGHPGAPAILDTFELEQKGDRIRILDADGSVYEGQLAMAGQSLRKDPAGVSATAELKKGRKVESPKMQKDNTKAQTVSFRASGTNRSLNELVVLDCTLIPAVEGGLQPGVQTGAELGFSSAKPAASPVPQTAPSPVATTRQSTNLRTGISPESKLQQQSYFLPTRVQGAARIGPSNQIQINAIQVAP